MGRERGHGGRLSASQYDAQGRRLPSYVIEDALRANPFGLTRRQLLDVLGGSQVRFNCGIASLSLRVALCEDDQLGFWILDEREKYLERMRDAIKDAPRRVVYRAKIGGK